MTGVKCEPGAKCAAKAELDRTLISARTFPRFKVPKGKEQAHFKLMSRVIVQRAQRRCKGLGCSLPVAITAETDKALNVNRELYPDDVAPVGTLVMARLEAKAQDADRQKHIMDNKLEQLKTERIRRLRR